MPALAASDRTPPSLFEEPEARSPSLSLAEARREDAHWKRCYARERYHRSDRDYEDYAPAYCAGYVGFAQYGGSFEDAERSLVSNWLRIRGDSRLDLEEAGLAMRAAWQRMEQAAVRARRWRPWQALVAGRAPAAAAFDPDARVDASHAANAGAWRPRVPQVLTAQP